MAQKYVFTARLIKPGKNNKYYIRKANGGYSDAILGRPTDPDCNVLANCSGYSYGRFNEVGQWGFCKYLAPVNAENFMKYAQGCEIGMSPKVGAVMVWQKGPTQSSSDGAGHVANVEQIVSETEVITSESSYNGSAFYTKRRSKGDNGKWGQEGDYTFLGFIYNPAVPAFEVGSIVEFAGGKNYVSQNSKIGYSVKAGQAEITKIKPGSAHPYHLVRVKGKGSNVWGWVDAITVRNIVVTAKVGDIVNFYGGTSYDWQGATVGHHASAGQAKITKIYTDGSAHPYHLIRTDGSASDVWGFVDDGTFEVVSQ